MKLYESHREIQNTNLQRNRMTYCVNQENLSVFSAIAEYRSALQVFHKVSYIARSDCQTMTLFHH